MNRIFFTGTISIIIFFIAISAAVPEDKPQLPPLDYLKDIRIKTLGNLPDNFTGVLFGVNITNKLASIPKDSYLDKNKKIFVEIRYDKVSGISIIVQNVDELYRDLYKDLSKQFFAFDLILSSQSNDSFLDKYDVSYNNNNESTVVLKLNVKQAENALLLYINSKNNQIIRVDYLLGKDILSSTIVSFGQYRSGNIIYFIPDKFITKVLNNSRETKPEILDIIGIKIKPEK